MRIEGTWDALCYNLGASLTTCVVGLGDLMIREDAFDL